MRLYEISQQFRALEVLVDQGIESQEDADAYAALYQELDMSFAEKAEGIACLVKNISSDIDAIDAELVRLRERKSTYEARSRSLKKYLSQEMIATGNDKLKTPLFTIYLQKNPDSVEAIPEMLPDEFVRIVREADKSAIKAAILKGQEVPGAQIIEGERGVRFK